MRTKKNILGLAAVVTATVLLSPVAAVAHPDPGGGADDVQRGGQHGEVDGHLPATQENVELVGRVNIDRPGEGKVADVAAYGNTAYLTVRDPEGCSDAGVAIMDITNPAAPRQTGFIEATEGSFPGEGAHVLEMATPAFTGRVLLFNNETCLPPGADPETFVGKGGVSLWDVTDPSGPKVLRAHAGDRSLPGKVRNPAFNEIHSVLGWTDGGKAYAALVDNFETKDVDILDISDPRRPRLISESDLNAFGVLQEEATPIGEESFLHDIEVQELGGRMTMVASYWDGGWTLLDVEDPANPKYLRDFDYPAVDAETGLTPSEGNAHQAEFSPDGRFIIGTDEDFAPYRPGVFSLTTGPAAGEHPATSISGGGSAADTPDKQLDGPVVYGGYGCPGSAPIPPADEALAGVVLAEGEERIVVLQRGPSDDPSAPEEACFPGEKAAAAVAAGYDAVLIASRHLGSAEADAEDPFCGSGGFPTDGAPIPTVCTSHEVLHLLFGSTPVYDLPYVPGTEPVVGTVGERVRATAEFDGWGYVRLLNSRTMEQIDTYAIPESLDPAFASGFGDLSVHEVAVNPRKQGLAYLSYYSGGLRVIKYSPNGLREVGSYIAEGGNNFWGVESHLLPAAPGRTEAQRDVVLASDRDGGLFIFRYTGPQ